MSVIVVRVDKSVFILSKWLAKWPEKHFSVDSIRLLRQSRSISLNKLIGNQTGLFITFLVCGSRALWIVLSVVTLALFLCQSVGDKKGKFTFKTTINSPSV